MVKEVKTVTRQACHHCGESCEEEAVQFQEYFFCCAGCQTVYQLLSDHGLENYYQLTEKAKPKLKNQEKYEQYACFRDESIRQRFINFDDGGKLHTQFRLPDIHCSSCLWLLEKLPWLHEGICQAKVNYVKKELFIVFDSAQISLEELAIFLAKLGYPPHISHDQEATKEQPNNKTLLYKLGVTGFCAGNIMLMSFPEYLGYHDLSPLWKNLFAWLSFAFCLPIVFWTANHYWLSAWQAVKNRVVNIDVPISIGLMALFSRSLYEIISQTGAGYFDSLSALIFFLLIGRWLQERTYAHISFDRDYKSYFPIAITRIEKDAAGKTQETVVPIEKLAKGDEILVRNGELIPADAILKAGNAQIDFSFITGESNLVHKQVGELVYAGGRQKGGLLQLVLTKTVSQSYLIQLWNTDHTQKNQQQHQQSLTDQLSPKFTLAVILIAIAAGLFWLAVDSSKSLNAFTAVLIVACPCALALNVPFTLGNVLRILAQKGFYIKHTEVVERIPNIKHIVFDKTGTVTAGNTITYTGQELSQDEKEVIYALTKCSTHPISKQIHQYLAAAANTQVAEEVKEVAGEGIEAWVGDHFVQLGKASFVGQQAVDTVDRKTGQSFVSVNGQLLGYFSWKQAIREGIAESLAELSTSYELSLLSGDKSAAQSNITNLFPPHSTCRFEQEPKQKMTYLKNLQNQQQASMMLGDGLNDAGAIKAADIGIAISDDIHQFTPSSDAILLGKNLPLLPKILQFAKASIRVVKVGYLFSILYNLVGIAFAVQGLLSPVVAAILMSLSSISVVVWGDVVTNWLGRKLHSM